MSPSPVIAKRMPLGKYRPFVPVELPDRTWPDRKPPKYFQVLLETTVENYVPGKASFVSARVIPDELARGMTPQ